MPDHALELSFEEASAQAVIGQWEALRAAGLPSQADHRSMTNAPHLTLVAIVGIDPLLVPVAVDQMYPCCRPRSICAGSSCWAPAALVGPPGDLVEDVARAGD